jgi:hypothetical protein
MFLFVPSVFGYHFDDNKRRGKHHDTSRYWRGEEKSEVFVDISNKHRERGEGLFCMCIVGVLQDKMPIFFDE